jgi:flotillin
MMNTQRVENSYLGEVLEQQQKVDLELKARKRQAPMQVQAPASAAQADMRRVSVAAPEPSEGGGRAIDFKITGWGRWKTVVVPPNVYVVHTRRGYEKPQHIGMGVSFRFNPYTDAFLVIPAAMQTIVINARCICVERQGILVQAYVQWIIDDIATAYRKLDFSDAEDPMRIVNVQLREQAEAAIKDKVATMRIDEVLADKQPIIAELTLRLRQVAEGTRDGGDGSGLGLKIVTVQIKEAVVSSTRLWESLQKPFRAERERLARMAELETERQIAARELEIRQARETSELETERAVSRARADAERETFDRQHVEQVRRAKVEQEAQRAAVLEQNATEKSRREAELDLALASVEVTRKKTEAEVLALREMRKLDAAGAERTRSAAEEQAALDEIRAKGAAAVAHQEIGQMKARRAVENDLSENLVKRQLISALPQIAEKLPAPTELRSVNISSDGAGGAGAANLTSVLASLLALVDGARGEPKAGKPAKPA